MKQNTDLFKTILVPVDFSPCSDEAFRVACQVARLCGATLLVLHVIDTSALAAFNRLGLLAVPSDAAPQRRRLRHHARLKVRQLLESKVAADVKMTGLIVEGAPFVEIAKVAYREYRSSRDGKLWRPVGQCGQDFLRQHGGKGRSHRWLSRPDRAACYIRLTTQSDALRSRGRRS